MGVEAQDPPPPPYCSQLEAWLADPYSLDEEWTERARVEVREDPATVRSNVRALRDKIQAEESLYARTDDLFLLAFLRARKHNVDDAFRVLKNYYQARSNYPQFFELCLPSARPELYGTRWINVLADKDQLGRPVIYFRADFDATKLCSKLLVQMLSHTLDMLIMDPHVQISGVAVVCDLSGQGMGHFKLVTPTFVGLMSRIFQETFPVRLRSSTSFRVAYFFKAIWSLFRPLIKEKIRNRNHLLGDDLKILHEQVTPDILPTEAGGSAPYCPEVLQERLEAIEDYLREWNNYGYNKKPPQQ